MSKVHRYCGGPAGRAESRGSHFFLRIYLRVCLLICSLNVATVFSGAEANLPCGLPVTSGWSQKFFFAERPRDAANHG